MLHDRWSWLSILLAMLISSMAGLLLERFVSRFESLAVLSPIINGLGGNLGAVLASRLATALHTGSNAGQGRVMAILAAMVAPLSLAVLLIVRLLGLGHAQLSFGFVAGFCLAAQLQVLVLLAATWRFVRLLWDQKLDPDNVAIPFVTALGDVLGTAALVLCFLAVCGSLKSKRASMQETARRKG